MRQTSGGSRVARELVLSLLLASVASVACDGGGAGPPVDSVGVVVTGLAPFAVHHSSIDDEIVLETHVLTPDGAPHPSAVFTWRYPGKAYQGFATDPDPDLSFVEETGPGGLQRLRVRSARAKRGGLFVSCVADVPSDVPGVPAAQATCESQALTFWGGAATDLLFPFSAITMGVGEVRATQALATADDDESSHQAVLCEVADGAVASAEARDSVCVLTAKSPGQTVVTYRSGAVAHGRPLTVTATPLGPPPVGAVTDLAPQGATPQIAPAWLRSDGRPIPAALVGADPAGNVAFAAAMHERQAVFQWTGTGFGWTFATPPGARALSPASVAFDARGALYASIGEHGLALRDPDDAPGAWHHIGRPASAWVTGITANQFDDSNPIPSPPEGAQWYSLLPRTGGGVWLAWVTVKGWTDYPDKVCRFHLELAEIDPDRSVRHETVLVAEKRWAFAVANGASLDCLSGYAPLNGFVEPVPQLIREGAHHKPDIDLLRHDVVFPASATPPDSLTLTPAGLSERHLVWDGAAWTTDAQLPPDGSRAIARAPAAPPLVSASLADAPHTTADTARQRPYDYTDDPERFFYFDDPRLIYRGTIGAASVPLPGHKVFELDTTLRVTGWRVVDLPPNQPAQQLFPDLVDAEAPIIRPPVVLPDGRRFAFAEPVRLPYTAADPGALVLTASSATGPWSTAAAPTGPDALPAPFATFRDRAFALPGELVMVAADPTTFSPWAARSADGATFRLCPDGPLPTAAGPATAWVGPDGVAFALVESTAAVHRSADVRGGVWEPIDALQPELVGANAALSNVRRDLTWAASPDASTVALLALAQLGGGAPGPELIVRRYSAAGALLDAHRVALPAHIALGVGDRFEPTGAALLGDQLVVYQATGSAADGPLRLDLAPLVLDLGDDTWTAGPTLATIYGADPYGQNHWHRGLDEQADALSRDAFSPLVFTALPDGRVAAFGSAIRPDGREAVFYAVSDTPLGLADAPKTYLRPDGGFHQRVVGAAPEPTGGFYLLYGDGSRPLFQFGALEHAFAHVAF
jgi:hypothetical protein